MAETFPTYIERRLKDDYKVELWSDGSGDWYSVKNPLGQWVIDPQANWLIRFKFNDPEHRTRENIVAALRRAGAIRERTRSSDTSRRPTKSVSHKEPKNSVIIAQETLRDVLASPRERALARNYLELLESHKRVRALAQKLGLRLKELEKLID